LAFKAKAALAAIKGEKTLAELAQDYDAPKLCPMPTIADTGAANRPLRIPGSSHAPFRIDGAQFGMT
jgi:hypothetical protein